MERINATSLRRKSGQWGTQPPRPAKRAASYSHLLIVDQIAEGIGILHDCSAAINGKTFELRSKTLL